MKDTRVGSALLSDVWTQQQESIAHSLKGPIFIVGASGFIGAKLFYSLSARRNDVFAVSRSPNQSWRLALADPAQLISLDVSNTAAVRQAITKYRPRTVFNLSAFGAYEKQRSAQTIHQVNYFGNLNLILPLMEMGCDAFVQAGSSSEYGLNCSAPKESDLLVPNSDYAVSKAAASYLIQYYGKFHQFPCVNLRLYSIYGPWEERDRLIPSLISNGLKGQYPPFAERHISRDFVYVDDCTHAIVKAALTVCQNPDDRGISINLATGKKTSLEEIANLAQDIFQISDSPKFGDMKNRKWDLSNWYGDPTLASEKMAWSASTSLEAGLKHTIEWEKVAAEFLPTPSAGQPRRKISAIIACYRDHQAIPIMHQRLTAVFQKLGVNYEIIFVNDCSPTQDEQTILNLTQSDPHVIGVSHSRNFGSQSAFFSGMEVSSGDGVVLLDGDLQDPPELIEQFYQKWINGADIVYGKRVKRQAPLHMQVLYKLFYRLFKYLADFEIPVDAGDFSLIDRKVVNHLLKFPEKDLFLRGLRAWLGFRQEGVPYKRPERMFGHTTNNFWKNIWWAKKGIFSYSSKPLDYIQRVGVMIFLISLLLSLFYGISYFVQPPQNARGVTTIILLTLVLGGTQLISLSILGDYIGKILDEVKNRPRFIRSKVFTGGETYQSDQEIQTFVADTQKWKRIGSI